MKVAIVFVGLLAMSCGLPSHKGNVKGAIADLGDLMVKINEAVGVLLELGIKIIGDIQENGDQIRQDAEEDASKIIGALLDSLNKQLTILKDNVNENAGELIQCVIDQQPDAQTAGETAATSIIESVATNIHGIGDSLVVVIKDLQESNADLNVLDKKVAECESEDDPDGCALDVLVDVIKGIAAIPSSIADDVDLAVAEVKNAAEKIIGDAKDAIAKLTEDNVNILNSVATCAAN